jgi:threonylcarbamoyladenosine tRNA methylthiotransferase MtaB
VSLGCRVAQSDLDAAAASLGGAFALAAPGEPADYVVVSTCTVTADADAAARKAIRRAARERPGARIVACGCAAELRRDELAALPGVAAVVGPRSNTTLAQVLLGWEPQVLPLPAQGTPGHAERGQGRGEEATARSEDAVSPAGQGRGAEPHRHARAFLKVQDGCYCACAYCAVPLARGPARSLPFAAALEAIARHARESPEVVLTGVHLGAYGRDLAPRRSLADLVGAAVDGGLAPRLRLSSLEPLDVPLDLFAGPARAALCDHVHLPVQSGSDAVLAAMRRPYRARDVAAVVERLAAAAPGICLGADVITGFPGETEPDHRATVALVDALPFAYLHVFPFSPRPGTAAASMRPRVPERIARERAAELRELSRRRWAAFVDAQRGRVLEVAVERVAGGHARGTARNYASVRWPAGEDRRGELARVLVEASDGETCSGRRVP